MEQNFQKYLFEYYHDGAWWSLVIPAPSQEDAMERLKLIHRAKFLGTLHAEIPAMPGTSLLTRLLCWWRNRLNPAAQ